MNILNWSLLSISFGHCEAFLPAQSSTTVTNPAAAPRNSDSRLHGIREWRDQALESKYSLESYRRQSSSQSSPSASSPPERPSSAGAVPAAIPILPFPFPDILLQGQRTQLNLYEQRFHELFRDAVENHCGMVGMGLLAGNGMITTLPLCEVESFTRFGASDDWVDEGDGMGNGCILVTIRAVGRAKITEDDLLQEEPYMTARVVEIVDEDASVEGTGTGLKEKGGGEVKGESSPSDIASMVAGNIENMMVSLASMEYKLKEMEERKEAEEENDIMNRRMVNAQLESLFMQNPGEGVDMGSAEGETIVDENEGDDEGRLGEDDETDDGTDDEADDEKLDRVAQFQRAFESAKETDTFGYVLQTTPAARTPEDLTAISWAAFCTGDENDAQRDVMKIQALDMVNILQRLQLAAAMLGEERKKWKTKLALAEIRDVGKGES